MNIKERIIKRTGTLGQQIALKEATKEPTNKPIVLHGFDIESKSRANFTCIFSINPLHNGCFSCIVQPSEAHKKRLHQTHSIPTEKWRHQPEMNYQPEPREQGHRSQAETAELNTYTMKIRISFSFRFTFLMIVSNPMIDTFLQISIRVIPRSIEFNPNLLNDSLCVTSSSWWNSNYDHLDTHQAQDLKP